MLALIQRRGVEDIFVDFKRNHPAGAMTNMQREQALGERLKDILAFANTRRTRPAYLIVGVTDERDIVGIDRVWDDGDLQDTFRGKANRRPVFRDYEVVVGSGIRVGVFEVPADQPRPSTCGHRAAAHEHIIYVRRGSTNASLEPDQRPEVFDAPPPLSRAGGATPTDDIRRLAIRWLELFETHGVRRHQIPALLPNHHVPLSALTDWQQTAVLLGSDRLRDDTCALFNVRRAWLEGDSDRIYEVLPLSEEVDAVLETLEGWAQTCEEIALLGFRDGRKPLDVQPHQTCAFMLRGTIREFGEKPVFQYQPVYGPFEWDYPKGRVIARTAWLAARVAGCSSWGWRLIREQIDALCGGRTLPDSILTYA